MAVGDLIKEEDIVLTLTHSSYIKRLPVDTYRNQNVVVGKVDGTKEEDFVEHLFVTTTHHNILFLPIAVEYTGLCTKYQKQVVRKVRPIREFAATRG